MSSESIFDRIVRDENDYTEILCHLLRISDDFRRRILRLLVPPKLAYGIRGENVRTQVVLEGYGKPDVHVVAPDICALVEVKHSRRCAPTDNQDPGGDLNGDLKGYLRYLSGRPEVNRFLTYLVPRDWIYLDQLKWSLDNMGKQLHAVGIGVLIKHWDEVLGAIEPGGSEAAILVEEFRKLLDDQFGPFRFKREEIDMLFGKDFATHCEVVLKAEAVVEQIAIRARSRFEKDKVRRDDNVRRDDKELEKGHEYGYFITTPNTGKWGLWFGISPGLAEIGFPICFAVRCSRDKENSLQAALKAVWKEEQREVDGWLIWSSAAALKSTEPAEELWKRACHVFDYWVRPSSKRKAAAAGH
jgi:hypothetical protein